MNNIVEFNITKVSYNSFESAMEAAMRHPDRKDGKNLLVIEDDKGKYRLIPAKVSFEIIDNKDENFKI